MPDTNTPKQARAVTFSEFSELAFIPKDEACSKWFSKQEKQRFRQALIQDSRRISSKIKDTPAEDILPEQLYECVGIELFVTQGLARRMAAKKRAHMDAVLLEQSNQKQGIRDIETLSYVSKWGSRWTKERARKLAIGYSELSNE